MLLVGGAAVATNSGEALNRCSGALCGSRGNSPATMTRTTSVPHRQSYTPACRCCHGTCPDRLCGKRAHTAYSRNWGSGSSSAGDGLASLR
jgi:hypothetical protein